MTFAAALEAVDQLTPEEQEELTAIVRRRLAEKKRQQFVEQVKEAERDVAEGKARPVTVDELMDEIMS